jgi:hypothetical protein
MKKPNLSEPALTWHKKLILYTYPFQLTRTMHRDPYDDLLPSKPLNSQKGKIATATGAYGGIGSVFLNSYSPNHSISNLFYRLQL